MILNRCSSFVNIFIYDLKNSFKYNRLKFIMIFFVYTVICFSVSVNYEQYAQIGHISGSPSFGDYLVFSLKGMNEYVKISGRQFIIPFEWLSINLLIAFIIGNYTTHDLYGIGQQLLVRTNKKRHWIISKYLYCIYTIISVYFIGYLVMFIFSILKGGNIVLLPDVQFCRLAFGLDFLGVSSRTFFIVAIIQPIIVSITISVIQISLSWFLNPILSYVVITIYMISSAYFKSYFFIGNHLMLLRNDNFYANGLNGNICIMIDILIILSSFLFGMLFFKKFDIIKKN